jgi:hypothetical protein
MATFFKIQTFVKLFFEQSVKEEACTSEVGLFVLFIGSRQSNTTILFLRDTFEITEQ